MLYMHMGAIGSDTDWILSLLYP